VRVATPFAQRNRLLAAIPEEIYAILEPHLQEVMLKQRIALFEPGDTLDRIYFPQTGMISLLIVTLDGAGIEVATVGREGAVGLQRGLGKRRALTRATVQAPVRCLTFLLTGSRVRSANTSPCATS
jgi:CRP-like cAMP-binding protein